MIRIFLTLCLFSFAPWLTGCNQMKAPLDFEEEQQISRLVDQGTIYLRQGELERAESSFEMAGEIAYNPAAIDGLGCVAFLKGDFEQAYLYFIEAYNADRTYSQALANLALLYDVFGDKDLAQKVYERVLGEVPQNFRMRNNYAALMMESGEYDFSRMELMKAAALVAHPLVEKNLRNLP